MAPSEPACGPQSYLGLPGGECAAEQIEQLEALTVRSPIKPDRRVTLGKLTNRGRSVAEARQSGHEETARLLFDGIGVADVERFGATL